MTDVVVLASALANIDAYLLGWLPLTNLDLSTNTQRAERKAQLGSEAYFQVLNSHIPTYQVDTYTCR